MATARTAPVSFGANSRARRLSRLASGAMAAVAEHESPERLVARGWIRLSHDPPLEQHGDAVAQRSKLVEVGRDDDDRGACARRGAKGFVDAAGGDEVQAARRLRGDDEPRRRPAFELAGRDELLLVAAGQIGGPGPRVRRGARQPPGEAAPP